MKQLCHNFTAIIELSLIALLSLFILHSKMTHAQDDNGPKVKFYAETPDNLPKVLAVVFKNEPHWHTYWKNPGDAGTPTSVTFEVDGKEVVFDEYELPAPQLFLAEGDIHGIGYENIYAYFFKLPIDSSLEGKRIKIIARWLACNNICVPGGDQISGNFVGNSFKSDSTSTFHISKDELKNYFESLPYDEEFPSDIDLTINQKDNKLIFYYTLSSDKFSALNSRYILTPFTSKTLTFGHEQLYQNQKGQLYGKMIVDWDGEFEEPPVKLPINGTFEKPLSLKFLITMSDRAIVSTKVVSSFSTQPANNIEQLFSTFTLVNASDEQIKNSSVTLHDDTITPEEKVLNIGAILTYLLFAFIGGLILNLMPCVLPIISLKLFGLIKHGNSSKKEILKHNLIYSSGIQATLLVFSIIIIVIQSSGKLVGWGFQLQSPIFLLIMIFSIFIFALNMFGLFEFTTPLGNKLGNIQTKDGFMSDFLAGVFATILSTPCSAPFLGTALAFAFTSGPLTMILIFQAIGIGLAAPFILTGFFPALIKFLPRPGAWMDNLKKFLALTLILTVIWLIDVLISSITDPNSIMLLNLSLTGIFFTIFLSSKITKKIYWRILPAIATLLLVYALLKSILQTPASATPAKFSTEQAKVNEPSNNVHANWSPWSVAKMEDYKKNKELVFMDFTANWCFTCKINEKLVLKTEAFGELVKQHNVKLLLGDFTTKDQEIAAWLKTQNVFGVPAYFIITPKGEIIKLKEIISLEDIKNALDGIK